MGGKGRVGETAHFGLWAKRPWRGTGERVRTSLPPTWKAAMGAAEQECDSWDDSEEPRRASTPWQLWQAAQQSARPWAWARPIPGS